MLGRGEKDEEMFYSGVRIGDWSIMSERCFSKQASKHVVWVKGILLIWTLGFLGERGHWDKERGAYEVLPMRSPPMFGFVLSGI